jgi:hypothetical protein
LELDPQLTVHYLGFQLVEASRRRTRDSTSISAELSAVARAYELILILMPRNRTSEMWADGRKNLKVAIHGAAHKHRLMRYDLAPSIALDKRDCFCDGFFDVSEFAGISNFGPLNRPGRGLNGIQNVAEHGYPDHRRHRSRANTQERSEESASANLDRLLIQTGCARIVLGHALAFHSHLLSCAVCQQAFSLIICDRFKSETPDIDRMMQWTDISLIARHQ